MSLAPRTVVLLHGFASSFDHNWRRSGWVDTLNDLGCEVPEIDLPGHGPSAQLIDPMDYANVEKDLFDLLPAERPLTGVAFSVGGEMLIRIAVDHPGTFDKIVLLGVGDNLFGVPDSEAVASAMEQDEEPEELPARLFHRMGTQRGNNRQALAAFLRRPRNPLQAEELATVTCPVLLIRGDCDTVQPSAERLMAALPSMELVTVEGVDHFAIPGDMRSLDATMKFLGLV